MDGDLKWVGMLLLTFMIVPMCGLALNEYQHSQCRIEAIRAHMPADEIVKICGK